MPDTAKMLPYAVLHLRLIRHHALSAVVCHARDHEAKDGVRLVVRTIIELNTALYR
jgi:hypothetical protein